jgi:RimJ/RimL family protein N-acetyltransferase
MELSQWRGARRPERVVLAGQYARLEPLSSARHGPDLFRSAREPNADDRFRYLAENAPSDEADFEAWIQRAEASKDPLFFAVIDTRTDKAQGRQALMRIDTANGVVEVGHILWGPAIARSRVSTEALYLAAQYVFDELGYRRFEWKCHSMNEASKRAAERFGFTFEGIFRQHMVAKGRNRDTAWFAMTDTDWTSIKPNYVAWLSADNFDAMGQQRMKLSNAIRKA